MEPLKNVIVEKVEDATRFESLRGEWNELLADSAADCLFLTWEWLYCWWRHMAADRRLRLILVRDAAGRLIAIAPLTRRPPRWKRLLPFPAVEFLGSGSVGSDYLDLIIRRGEEPRALAALRACLAESGVVDFSQIRADGCHAGRLAQELERTGWKIRRTSTDLCPYIDLAGRDWDSYLSGLSAAHRYNLRRRLRNLQSKWTVDFARSYTEEQRIEGMREVIELHRLRWRSRGQNGVFSDPDMAAFHGEFSRLALLRGWLRLYVLRLDGAGVAAWYGFNYRGVTSYYQGGFAPAFQRHSVGLVAMGLAIQAAIDDKAQVFDFLRGDESYKSLWACRERELVRLELFPPCFSGALYRRIMELRCNIRKRMSRAGAAGTAAAPEAGN